MNKKVLFYGENRIVETADGVRTIIGGGTGATTSGAARDNLVVNGSLEWVAFEHFMYGTISPFAGQMTWYGLGIVGNQLQSANVSGLQGVNTFKTTAATGAQYSSIAVSPSVMPLDLAAVPRATFDTRVNFNVFPIVESLADGAVFRAGFMSARNSASSTGVYFELVNLSGALTLRCVQANNGTWQYHNIPVADLGTLFGADFANLSTRWVGLRIEKYFWGYQFLWSVAPPTSASGTPVGSVSLTSPIGRPTLGNRTGYGLHIAKSSGTNGYEVNVDYIYIRLQSTSDTVI